MIFEFSHKTLYRYEAPVGQSHHLLHLAPRPHPRQRIVRHALLIAPHPASRSDFTDYFGNPASVMSIESSHSELLIHSRGLIEVNAPAPLNAAASAPWESVARRCAATGRTADLDVAQYVSPSRYTPFSNAVRRFAEPSFPPSRPLLDCASDLAARIHRGFAYDGDATEVTTTIEEVLSIKRGVCQDFAHLMIAALRVMGVPARYVSGYLLTHPPAGSDKLVGADASHAWISVWAPDIGWVDLDPTNNIRPGEEHITIAYGRDFQDVSPVTGVLLGGGAHQAEVMVDVMPVLQTGIPHQPAEPSSPISLAKPG